MKTTLVLSLIGVGMFLAVNYSANDTYINVENEPTLEVTEQEEVVEISALEQARIQLEEANKKLDEEEARLRAEHEAAKAEWEAKEKAFKENLEAIKNLRVSFTQAPKQGN